MLQTNTWSAPRKSLHSLGVSFVPTFASLKEKVATLLQRHPPTRLDLVVAIGGVVLIAGAAYLFRGRKKGPEELEKGRRTWINSIGRITDGNVIDVQELNGNGQRPAQMIVYQYDVAGVSYEASQDITYLRQTINLHSCRLGIPTSVKYDPHNPGNSIVVSETWIGLRTN